MLRVVALNSLKGLAQRWDQALPVTLISMILVIVVFRSSKKVR